MSPVKTTTTIYETETKATNSNDTKSTSPLLAGDASHQQQRNLQNSHMNLSFAGCGFLGIYHVGVASCFKEYAPHISTHKICGSSAGALVAVAHLCGKYELGLTTTGILKVAMDARKRSLGPFHPSFDLNGILESALEDGLPEDAHIRASGILHVSLTRVGDGKNVIITEFADRQELITALLCSCFIPLFSGIVPPKLRGVAYVDGGFSNNLYVLDDKTITVSPFCGEADICPQDELFHPVLQFDLSGTSITLSPGNLYRMSHALLPPPPEILKELCQQGFDDGMRYLQQNKLISCDKCMLIKSPPNINVNVDDLDEFETMAVRSKHKQIVESNSSLPIAKNKRQSTHARPANKTSVSPSQPAGGTLSLPVLDCDKVSTGSDSKYIITSSSASVEDGQLYDCDNNDEVKSICNSISGYDSYEDDDCYDCRLRRQNAMSETLPQLFLDRIREVCDSMNKSLYNWLCSHRPIKYLTYLAAPYLLPVDLTLAFTFKAWNSVPSLRQELVNYINLLIDFLIDIVARLENGKPISTGVIWGPASGLIPLSSYYGESKQVYNSVSEKTNKLDEAKIDIKDEADQTLVKCNKSSQDKTYSTIDSDNNETASLHQRKQQVHPLYVIVDKTAKQRQLNSTNYTGLKFKQQQQQQQEELTF